MGFFSRLLGFRSDEVEEQVESMYVQLYQSAKGMSPREAREAVRMLIEQAKEEASNEGTTNLPPDFGDQILARENVDTRQKLEKKRREGVTNEAIRWWWNMPDLQRRMMITDDDATHMATYLHHVEQGLSPEESAAEVRKSHLIYGDPDDTSNTTGDDRPLPMELKDRVNTYVARRIQEDPAAFKNDIEASSTMNALIRREIATKRL